MSGILVGIPNYASAYLLLGALKRLPALLVYPAVSAGTLLVILVLSSILFQEQLTRRMLGGVCMILAALVLLNL
jgi:multidrug transporter EmrE-like cation transporter